MPLTYPQTRRVDVSESRFGHEIADPYRWLENDPRRDGEVARWVQEQTALARGHLDGLPAREVFRRQISTLFDCEQSGVPLKRGNRYFHTMRQGLKNQATLHVREGVDGPDRLLLDPNEWSEDSADAIAEWDASDDGAHVAYGVQRGGIDWREIKVLDVATGETLTDEIKWVRFGNIAWAKDGSGFFYSRYPEPEPGTEAQANVANHAIYFHQLGTGQAQDRLVHATLDRPDLLHLAGVTDDGRYLIIHSTPGASMTMVSVVDLTTADWTVRTVAGADFSAEWSAFGNDGTTLFVVTSEGAPRRRIVTFDLAEAAPQPREIIGEADSALEHSWLVGGRLILSYLVDASTELRRHQLDGTPDGIVELPGIGSAGIRGTLADDEAFLAYTSFNAPLTIYRYAVSTGKRTVWAEPAIDFDLGEIAVDQHVYASKDGTKVPIFVIRRKGVQAPAPTLLYGYGGFSISLTPYYAPTQLAWVAQGGTLAIANIRGGGEYGRAWHDAGRLANKQNSYDDFIAAAEFLRDQGIACLDGIAIQGESNGGLLVGAVTNQRPELFAAALPGIGVMDLLRFHLFTGGTFWKYDFGDPQDEAAFENLLRLSPYHNIAAGKPYPAILVTTADADDRVVPGHSFKYAAAIQAAEIGSKPRLLLVETRAGHGAGKPLGKVIAEAADMWAFAACWTGLEVGRA
ncbi:prolyl endopeptidase [Bosea sp. Root483D1]|uniref:prolyl oligopeptidase family serine peptidase n=1 Tax=Bosea sp. Root483D1 TaxID=1736544 RepID=UPI00070CC97F|nr:prolyl oligopeptidase family serine peptidase [Bosea sp. Root483D1]KRE12296.1 prolyl endopeptidase [Bosea sp. Root483D1]